MDDLLFARLQMAMSLGFHIVFAVIGIGMPALMAAAEWRWLRTGDAAAKELAKRWAKGTAVFFAVGAVSGTVLSFELGLLWPRFMEHAGGIIGFPFGLEGFAFFTEAIFLGIYLYGWDRVGRWAHWWAGVVVGVSGAASAVFVVMVNAWMNTPAGFEYDPATGMFSDIDPVAAMFSPAWAPQVVHMLVAAYMAAGFGAAGVHAWGVLRAGRDRRASGKKPTADSLRSLAVAPAVAFHRRGLRIAMAMGASAAVVQPIVGDWAAKTVARTQPVKLAAMEGQFRTERRAPLRIGGWPEEEAGETRYAVEIPGALSFLGHGSFDAEVRGLEEFPREVWPPVAVVHVAFQVMVGCGVVMLGVGGAYWGLEWWGKKKRKAQSENFKSQISNLKFEPRNRLERTVLWGVVACAPLGFVAIEAGWVVTEVGRQPWIIQGVMRTSEAVTPMPGLLVPFVTFTVIYVFLAGVVTAVMVRQVRATTGEGTGTGGRVGGAYGP